MLPEHGISGANPTLLNSYIWVQIYDIGSSVHKASSCRPGGAMGVGPAWEAAGCRLGWEEGYWGDWEAGCRAGSE
eukprot:scaffold518663_cov39-Prasinocladus_malaysianus.AAC.1